MHPHGHSPDDVLTTPVIVIIFNRPQTTQHVISALARVRPPRLLVLADGARANRPDDATKCAAARALFASIDWPCDLLTNYSDVNLGGRRRAVTGLTWAFSHVDEAIVLDDDCVPTPSFFFFCQDLLRRYRTDARVMAITGNNFQASNKRTSYSYYFSRYFHGWGWATWARAWARYDDHMTLWPAVREEHILEQMFPSRPQRWMWERLFDDCYTERFTAGWDYRFLFACWLSAGLIATPRRNLVSNVGFGPDAQHTRDPDHKFANMVAEELEWPLRHPPLFVRHRIADEFVQRTVFDRPPLLARGFRRCKRTFNVASTDLRKWLSQVNRLRRHK